MSRLAQSETKKNQTPSKSSSSRALLQYKNGFFQGYIDQYNQRQGRGVYFWNTGEIYYGDWNQDHMEGEGIFYFALGGYVYGTFLDDRVHGYAVLCFSNGDYTAGFWEKGVLNGKVVQHSNVDNDWCLEDYRNGTCVRVLMKGKGLPPFENFSMIETYSLKKLLEKGSGLFIGGKDGNERGTRAHLDFLAIDPDGWYHGNIQDHEPHGLGIVCYSEHKSDRGLFKDGALNGLGRSFFSNGDVYDGFYKKGKFHGIGVYFKSETEQYLYGMYESNECVQALTLGNGYPHELMRNIKADFHIESAEFIDKETETEVLTLSCDDQSPPQEQEENSIEYEEAAKYHAAEKKATEKRTEQQKSQNTLKENESESYVHESESSELSQRRAVESEKIRNDTHSSMSSKKSRQDQQGFSFEANSNKKYKEVGVKEPVRQVQEKAVNSRAKLSDQGKAKNTSSSGISDDQNELFVNKKSVPVSEVLDQKSASRGTVESRYKSAEKNAHDSYMSRSSELEKDVVANATSTSCLASPQKDYQSNAQSKLYNDDSRGTELYPSQKHISVENERMETFNAVSTQQWDSPSKVSNPYVTRNSEMIEKFSSTSPYEGKVSSSYSASYTIADRSPAVNTDPVSSYTVETTNPTYEQHQIQTTTTPVPTVSTNIMGGIDLEVKKIMDKIFVQNNTIPSLSLPLNPSTESDKTRASSHFLASPEIYPKPSDRSPTFAQSSVEPQGFDYKQYNGSYLDHKERTPSDHLTTDWNLRIFPSLEASIVNSEAKKTLEIPQATASFGLIPSAPSEESLTSKMLFACQTNRQSQASNTFLEVEGYTRDRAVSGKFGGGSECNTNLVVVSEMIKECHTVDPIQKSYNFTGHNQISTSYEDIDAKTYLKAKTPINKKIEHSKEMDYEHYSPVSQHGAEYSRTDYIKTDEHLDRPHEERCLKQATSLYGYPTSHYEAEYQHIDYAKSYENLNKSYEEHHLKAPVGTYTPPIYESPSGRASIISKTDTWSVPTVQKILDVGSGSLEKSAEMTTSQILLKYGYPADINAKRSSLYEATSEILDTGSISNRCFNKESIENKYQETPVSSMPMHYLPPYLMDKELSNGKLEEDLSKIIMLKLELLVREQTKATEAMDGIKKSLNEKLDALFREEKRESETFKILLNQKLESLFKEKTLDFSKEQLAQIHHELTGNQKQVNASFNGVNKKLDLLLLKQGRLNVETEENLVNKLETMMNKHTRHESLQFASHNTKQFDHKESIGVKSEDPRRSLKNYEPTENVRSEIFIADSSAEYNTANKRKAHTNTAVESKMSKSDISDHTKNSYVNSVTSNKEHRRESSNIKHTVSNTSVLIKDFTQNTEISKSHAVVRKQVDNDVCNISDDAMDYASIASDSAPLKMINSMQPKSKELSIKNEHTINLLQYESELRKEKHHRAADKSDKEAASISNDKALQRSFTPQSKNHTEISQRNYERSPRPITSQNSSMIIDTQPPTHRQSKGEMYTSGKSPVSNQRENLQVSFKGHESSSSEKQKSVYTFPVSPTKEKDHSTSPSKETAHWHMIPLCAQDSLLDEPEERIHEERLNSDQPSEERKTQALPSPGNFTNRSHLSKGPKSELKKNSLVQSHNRANSISSQSSYNVFDLKSHRLSVTKAGEGSLKKERVPNNTAQSVFDNFVVTSNNNDIPSTGEYVRIEKNSAVHRNMAFMNGPKIMSSAKKHSHKEVDLYEEEARNKKKASNWRKEEEMYDGCSTGHNQAGMGTRSSHKGNKTVYQEGRLGTVRWRFEIEDMGTEGEGSQMYQYESERRDEYDSAEMKEHYGNLAFDKKIKSISAMNSPISQRREFDHLMKTVNISKDIGTYENNMYSPCKNRPEDVISSSRTGHNVKIPSLRLGHETQEKTYFVPNETTHHHTKKNIPYSYGNLTISHVDHDMK